jgi:integrase/recombinase XerD
MKVKDYYTQGRRGWIRLHEKGGKEHEVPCHHTLEKYLDEYIASAGIAGEPDGELFRSTGRKKGINGPLYQQDVYRMIVSVRPSRSFRLASPCSTASVR